MRREGEGMRGGKGGRRYERREGGGMRREGGGMRGGREKV